MKLYVWSDPYNVSYGSSMLIVVAESETEARTKAMLGKAYKFGEFEQDSLPMHADQLGAPTRVVDLPCAEWHEWSE